MLKQYEGVYYADWPAAGAKAAVLMVHGMGAHSGRYAYLAERLIAEKISGYAIELQGFGELSGGKIGHVDSMRKYHESLSKLKKLVNAENPGKPVFILGESMGGLIATTQALVYDHDFIGLVAIAPAYRDVLKISGPDRLKIFLQSIFNSAHAVKMPFVSEELTSDPGILAKIKADPKEHRMASASLLKDNLLEQLGIMLNIHNIKVPVLMLLAGKDMLVDTAFAIELFKKIKTDKKYIVYPDSLHALTIEKNREEVFGDIVKWINSHIAK
jgi:alpha-beta hydrolase superfamily lysophospholipase